MGGQKFPTNSAIFCAITFITVFTRDSTRINASQWSHKNKYTKSCLDSSEWLIACRCHVLQHMTFIKYCIMELHSLEEQPIIERSCCHVVSTSTLLIQYMVLAYQSHHVYCTDEPFQHSQNSTLLMFTYLWTRLFAKQGSKTDRETDYIQ